MSTPPSDTSPTPVDSSRWATARRLALIASAYALTFKLALDLPRAQGILAAVWPPGGVALAALLLSPRQQRRAILATIFVTGSAVSLLSGRPLLASIGFMVGNVLETWGCAWLFARWCRNDVTFARLDDVLALAACAVVVNGVTALVGAAATLLAINAPFHVFYVDWWIADGLGILYVTPLVVVCAQPWRRIVARHRLRQLEATMLGVVWCVCAWVSFFGADAGLPVVPRPSWICVPLVWAALRFGTRVTTILLTVLAVISVGLTASGRSDLPFGGSDPVEGVQRVQLFLGVVALAGLTLAAMVSERKLVEAALEDNRVRLALAMDQAHVAYWEMDAVTRTFTFNDRFYAIYGTTAEREGGYRMSGEVYAEAFLPVAEQHVVPDDVTRLMSGDIEELQREHRILRRDGDLRDVVVRVTVARDATGRIVGTRGSNQDITDLRRLEAEREQFFTLFNIASDVMVIADPDGCFKRVNPAAIKLLGYSEEELLGRPFINFVHPDDRQLTLDEMARQIQVGRSMDVANRYVCKDGSVRWLSWRASYVAKEHATYATARDCTEQHLVEEALRDSEERFRSFFELSADLVCIADNDGRFRVVNSAFSNVLGYSKEELVSRAYLDFVHPEDRKKTLRITAERLKRGETVMHIENRYVRKNGEIVWLEWTSRASVSKGLTFAIARDITERKKTDERLLQVMAAVESSSNAIGISDLQRRHFYQNKAYTELFGYATAAELQAVGGGAATVCDPAVGKELFETILAGKTWSGELKLVTKRGRVFDAFERADAIKDEDGRSIGLIGVVTDISDRVAQQQRLHGLLAQAEQDARTKGELLREVNHRVTNNLTAVLGLISFELRHSRNDPQSITSALSRLNQHIRGMLVVHRLLSQSAWAPVSVQELAGKIIRAALSTAGWRRPAMLTVKPGELRVSPRQAGTLAMVINELATNTVKYASRPTGAVSVGFEFGSDINGIMLRYRDNGPGYPPDVLANERSDIGLKLITEMVTKSLGGSIVLSNDDGAVATLRIRSEEEDRT